MAQRSKKSRKSGSPKIFSGTARGQFSVPPSPPSKKRLPLGSLFCFMKLRGTRSLVDACCISCAAILQITAYSFRSIFSSQKVTLRFLLPSVTLGTLGSKKEWVRGKKHFCKALPMGGFHKNRKLRLYFQNYMCVADLLPMWYDTQEGAMVWKSEQNANLTLMR